jgi:hypothetical protein
MIIDPKHWHDISNETSRTYHYADGGRYIVKNPHQLNIQVSSQGGHSHRLTSKDENGVVCYGHYISPGWVAISWTAPEGGFKF